MTVRTVCFFARVKDRDSLERVEFYAQDILALRELGYRVHIATKLNELRPADVFFVWWWTWAFVPVAMARLLGRPVVITGTFDAWAYPARPLLHRVLIALALRFATANIFVSKLEYRTLPSIFAVNRPIYCPHTVDTDVYCAGDLSREDLVLSIVGMDRGNSRRKCVAEIIRAAGIIRRIRPEVRFVIGGVKGSDYPDLERLAEETGVTDTMVFPGILTQQQKIEFMRRCKVYLQPSRFEGFGLAVLEAMSCAAAVITSPVGAVPEVVGDTAVFVDGTDPIGIAGATLALLNDPARCQDLGSSARQRATVLFSYERRQEGIKNIIENIF